MVTATVFPTAGTMPTVNVNVLNRALLPRTDSRAVNDDECDNSHSFDNFKDFNDSIMAYTLKGLLAYTLSGLQAYTLRGLVNSSICQRALEIVFVTDFDGKNTTLGKQWRVLLSGVSSTHNPHIKNQALTKKKS